MYNVVSTLAPSFFIGSSLSLKVTRTAIKSYMESKFSKIEPGSVELAAFECPIDLYWQKEVSALRGIFGPLFLPKTESCFSRK